MSRKIALLIAGLFSFTSAESLQLQFHEENTMSNVNPHFQNLSLDPAEMIAASEAYDLACRTLQNIGQLEVDREIIARGILGAVKTGEQNANKLCERAIHGLTAFDYRQRDQ
jgi:hypothetical protein